MLRPYCVSWWDDPYIEFHLVGVPHWVICETTKNVNDNQFISQYCFLATVMATDQHDAARQITEAYDFEDPDIEWCFVEEQPLGWSPFSGNKPRKDWMVWNQRPH